MRSERDCCLGACPQPLPLSLQSINSRHDFRFTQWNDNMESQIQSTFMRLSKNPTVFFNSSLPTSCLLYAPTWTPTEGIIQFFFPLITLSSENQVNLCSLGKRNSGTGMPAQPNSLASLLSLFQQWPAQEFFGKGVRNPITTCRLADSPPMPDRAGSVRAPCAAYGGGGNRATKKQLQV